MVSELCRASRSRRGCCTRPGSPMSRSTRSRAMHSTTTTLRAESLSTDESHVLAPPMPQRLGGRLGLAVAGKTPLLFPPTRMDSGGGGGEVGEVPQCSPTTASMRSQSLVAVGEPMQRVAPSEQLLDPIGEARLDIGQSSGPCLAPARVRAWTSHRSRSVPEPGTSPSMAWSTRSTGQPKLSAIHTYRSATQATIKAIVPSPRRKGC
jgi:hypothetical protein